MTARNASRRFNGNSEGNRVRLVLSPYSVPRELLPFRDLSGTVEGYVGDDVLVRFGKVVIQVPSEWLEPAE